MNIIPITTWYKGTQRQANIFTLYSTGDNLLNYATFQYQLIELIGIIPEEHTSQTLIIG